MKYRFSGVFPFVLSLAASVLTLVTTLAGHKAGALEGQYLVAVSFVGVDGRMSTDNCQLNTSRMAQDVITFGRVEPSTACSAAPDQLDPRRPLATSKPLKQTGVRDVYYVYMQKICSGRLASSSNQDADEVKMDNCHSWKDAGDSMKWPRRSIRTWLTASGISAWSRDLRSSTIVEQARISRPLVVELGSSLDRMLGKLGATRKAMFGMLIVSLVGSVLSTISILPAMYFPQSRLLIYMNMFWPGLATGFAFVAAMLLSAMMIMVGTMQEFSDTVGVQIRQGDTALLLVWLSFVFVGVVLFYWASVWFIETRKWGFVQRRRTM